MTVDLETEDPLTPSNRFPQWLHQLWHRVSMRLLLLAGIVVLLTTVWIDSFQQQASAAGMSPTTHPPTPVSLTSPPSPAPKSATTPPSLKPGKTYLSFDAETAARLSHSDLTSATMTRSRLTSAHLFTHRLR